MKKTFISAFLVVMAVLLCSGLVYPAMAAGSAPVAENLELRTFRNVSVSGQLKAFDQENDVVKFEISTQPVKGHIELADDGSFVYTPNQDKKGKDYFGYRATDSEGNVSQEATVIIRIDKQKKDVSYSDMSGSAGEYAALLLSEEGVFTGEQIGGEYCFYPDKAVSRGEFLSMCMIVSDEPIISGVMSTGYSDDEDIPAWMKPYVATTVMCGMDRIDGESDAFQPDAAITKTEAVVMLNEALGLNDVNYIQLDETLAPETAQACANLSASGIMEDSQLVEETLSRIDAAELLSKALELMSRR